MNWRKIFLYILFSFAFSWTVALVMQLAHIKYGSPLSIIITAGLYMPAPALATFIIQKFIYKEGFKKYGWTFDKTAIRSILFSPLVAIALTFLTFAMIELLGHSQILPQFGQIDFSQQNLNSQLLELARGKVDTDKLTLPDIPPGILFVVMIGQAIIASVTLSLPFTFGEEFGWRGLLLAETQAMGFLKSSVFIGLVWGLWHAPVILMGHNYPHHPYFGIVMMCLFTLSVSPLFTYLRIKTKSIVGPCILHGMINATGAMYALYTSHGNELYTSVAGWAGIIAGIILTACIFLFDKQFVKEFGIHILPSGAESR